MNQELDILQIKTPKITDQNKHIRAWYHFITELLEEHNLDINYTPTQDMWANV